LFVVLLTIGLASTAFADRRDPQIREQAPLVRRPPPPSVTLGQGAVTAHVALEMSMSRGDVLAPASVAPDLSVGVTDWFTLAAITSGSALTGFRGSAGWGFCMTGTEARCRAPFSGGGVEGLVRLTRGSAALAANVGVLWPSVEPTVHTDLKVGFKLKLTDGNAFALFSPSVWIALDDRFDRLVPHEDQLWLPISLWVKPEPAVAIGMASGVKGPLERFADRLSIPLGMLAQLAIDRHVAVGTSFVFGKLLGAGEVMDPGIGARVVQVWIAVTSR
jgi:hypothetical protein